jgi:hypothetical protein
VQPGCHLLACLLATADGVVLEVEQGDLDALHLLRRR